MRYQLTTFVSVARDSIITDGTIQGRPLWLTLSQVSMRQCGTSFDMSGINFGFDNKEGLYSYLQKATQLTSADY